MIQNIIVILIGIIVVGFVSWRIFKMLTNKPTSSGKCGGCTGCALKVKMDCIENKTNI